MKRYSLSLYICLIIAGILILSSANCAGILGISHTRSESTLVITNNTCTGNVYEPADGTSSSCTMNIALSRPPGTRVNVNITSDNSLVTSNSRLTFNSSNWIIPQTATINLSGNGVQVPMAGDTEMNSRAMGVQISASAPGFLPIRMMNSSSCIIQGNECVAPPTDSTAEMLEETFTYQHAYCGALPVVNITTTTTDGVTSGMENDFFLSGTGSMDAPYIVPVQRSCQDITFTYNPTGMGFQQNGIYFQFAADGNTYDIDLIMNMINADESGMILNVMYNSNENPPRRLTTSTQSITPTDVMPAGSTFNIGGVAINMGRAIVNENTLFHVDIDDGTGTKADDIYTTLKVIQLHNPRPVRPPDNTPPSINTVTPSGTEVDSTSTNQVVITFSEPIIPGTGIIELINLGDPTNPVMFNIADTTPQVTIADRNLTLLNVTLEESSSYAIGMPAGVVLDESGNPNAPRSGTQITFTTSPDPPVFMAINQTGAMAVEITFNQNIVLREPPPGEMSYSITFINTVDNSSFRLTLPHMRVTGPMRALDGTITNPGPTLTFTMLPLVSSTEYTVEITEGVVFDTAALPNNNAAITGTTISFTSLP